MSGRSSVETGAEAEKRAAAFLEKKGFRIIGRNFRSRFGEIDLIAEDGRRIVFVEVRCRNRSDYGLPEETVDRFKQNKLLKTAEFYLAGRGLAGKDARFDVVAAGKDGKIKHIENAFDA